ncbi:MAG TPA: hypothetical protein VIN40_02800 [Candidatus Tyrphobacter sp.]
MRRRSFIGICSAALGAQVSARLASARALALTPFNRVALVDAGGASLRVSALSTAQAYIFHYPYRGTPAFLIRLESAAAGGVGPGNAVVAFSAICAHQLSHPSKDFSPITYSAGYSNVAGRAGAIVCCAHHSVYDPAAGARVLSGPAPQALAAIELACEGDCLFATGVRGPDRFDDFFRAFAEDLINEFGRGQARMLAQGNATTILLDRYTQDPLHC